MIAANRPRRTALYMPGSNLHRLEKGRGLAADMLIMDLEDAVTPDEKITARDKVKSVLKEGGFQGREILVRINSFRTQWGEDDIKEMATCGADGFLLPKVESAKTVQKAADLMIASGAPADMSIWCMMETPIGILRAEEIATSDPKVAGLVMGTNDLAKDLYCLNTPDRLPMVTSLSLCLLVARAYGLAILDGIHLNLSDDDGFMVACKQGLEFGFDGKTLIHPKTIAVANKIFAPSADEITRARTIIAAYTKGKAEGIGAVTLDDGQLVEGLHAEEAARLLELAEKITELEKNIA